MRTTLLALLASLAVSWAGSYTYNGDTTDKPVWNRPVQNGTEPPTSLSAVGTEVPYEPLGFAVNQFGNYSLQTAGLVPSAWDVFGALYANGFDPANPLANCLRANDASDIPGLVNFTYLLNPGTRFVFVTTGFFNSDYGQYQFSVTGPGGIIPLAGDSDGDGIPNLWELDHGTDPLTPDAQADPDHDGFTNLQEYYANTDPLVAASHLQISLKSTGPGTAVLQYFAAPDRYHRVLIRSSLGSGPWSTLTNQPPESGTAPVLIEIPVAATDSANFYRLEAGLGGR